MIEEIYNWLRTYHGLYYIKLDGVDDANNGSGMFYRGETVLERHRDLLGKTLCRKRVIFCIRRCEEQAKSAAFFEALGQWVTQSPPVFGRDQTVCLRDAHCLRNVGLGLALWEAELEITFMEEDV